MNYLKYVVYTYIYCYVVLTNKALIIHEYPKKHSLYLMIKLFTTRF